MWSFLLVLPALAIPALAVPALAFEEGWEKARTGTYRPSVDFTADEGKWRLSDTISHFPEDCGVSPHTAEIISSGGGKALRLTSVVVDGDCADNVWVARSKAQDPRFSIPIGPGSKISFFEEGSLIDPIGHSGTCYALVPPCGDTVSLTLTDNHGNRLYYILQRAADREETGPPEPFDASYREIQLDPEAGFYERNVFADFSTIQDFVGSGAQIVSVEFTVNEWGTATLDQLSIDEVGGHDHDGAAACAAAQLKAVAGLVKAGLGCRSKFAKDPAKDPGSASLETCQANAEMKFTSAWNQATGAAACELEAPGSEVAESFFAPMDALYGAVVAGWDPANRSDRSLRSALLKGFGGLGGSGFSACSKNAKKPDPAALERALQTARAKFLSGADKAIASALKKGVVYSGASTTTLADELLVGLIAFCEEATP